MSDMNFTVKYGVFSFLLLVFACVSAFSEAQNKGQVLDGNSQPVQGVHVLFNDSMIAISDAEGIFDLKALSKVGETDTLVFSHVGYMVRKVPLSAIKANNYLIYLQEKIVELGEVAINASHQSLRETIRYRKLASLPEKVYAFGSLLINGKIYVVGGDKSRLEDHLSRKFSDDNRLDGDEESMLNSLRFKQKSEWYRYSDKMQVYDIAHDEWAVHPLKFGKRAYHNLHYSHDRIYVLGGKRLSRYGRTEYLEDKMEVYDIKQDTILTDNSNPHQAMNFASCLYGDNLIVMGGSIKETLTGKKTYSDKVHLFDLQSGYWYELGLMPQAKEAKGILVNDKIYLIGGFNGAPLTGIETYHPATGEWRKEGDLLEAEERPAIAVHEQLIYIFEGEKIQVYDTQTQRLKLYAIDLKLYYAELFCADEKLYIVGGCLKDAYSIYPSPYLYAIDLSEFDKTTTKYYP
jgi:hypothetical protein